MCIKKNNQESSRERNRRITLIDPSTSFEIDPKKRENIKHTPFTAITLFNQSKVVLQQQRASHHPSVLEEAIRRDTAPERKAFNQEETRITKKLAVQEREREKVFTMMKSFVYCILFTLSLHRDAMHKTIILTTAFAPTMIPTCLQLKTQQEQQGAMITTTITSNNYQHIISNPAISQRMTKNDDDAQELLRKARELRQQAEDEENHLHKTLVTKKQEQAIQTDGIINELFPPNLPKGQTGVWKVAETLEHKRFSAPCLERVVERLHEREIAAKGLEHVEPSLHHPHVKFERVADVNEEELRRVQGLIQLLIDAAAVLDEKVLKERHEKGTATHSVDSTHWCSGELSKRLAEKAHFLGREHEEQFKSRLEEFYEAARKKKHVKNDRNESTRMYFQKWRDE